MWKHVARWKPYVGEVRNLTLPSKIMLSEVRMSFNRVVIKLPAHGELFLKESQAKQVNPKNTKRKPPESKPPYPCLSTFYTPAQLAEAHAVDPVVDDVTTCVDRISFHHGLDWWFSVPGVPELSFPFNSWRGLVVWC